MSVGRIGAPDLEEVDDHVSRGSVSDLGTKDGHVLKP